jgi:hypothetical protein
MVADIINHLQDIYFFLAVKFAAILADIWKIMYLIDSGFVTRRLFLRLLLGHCMRTKNLHFGFLFYTSAPTEGSAKRLTLKMLLKKTQHRLPKIAGYNNCNMKQQQGLIFEYKNSHSVNQ